MTTGLLLVQADELVFLVLRLGFLIVAIPIPLNVVGIFLGM